MRARLEEIVSQLSDLLRKQNETSEEPNVWK